MESNMNLSNLSPQEGSSEGRKRVGRGMGSGQGKTAGKGHKGQKARKGRSVKIGFEGGQTPLYRRLPKRGFSTVGSKSFQSLNLKTIAEVHKGLDVLVDLDYLKSKKLVTAKCKFVKVFGNQSLKNTIHLKISKITAGARNSVEKAGGKIEENA